ncbi:T9SS type A sorting domain-containing protein [Olleya sp. YSTF-M6]|uniref:T9SS type A sorting domain-containing protein n=1 Tax=Olleya sediminilitoris TaxID=2795739 RepID=A0ABS1WM28_9FLAO|nr:T9SS type A sorting domain-containing protein [Olleya sediminilitoris]
MIDISSLPNGLYMVRLQDKNGNNTTKKLIKK